MTERPEQLQSSSDNLPPTEPIDLPPIDLYRIRRDERRERRLRDERIAALVHEAVERGVPTTDHDLGLDVVPTRHRGRRARRASNSGHALGLALLLAAQGVVGAIVGCLGTIAALGLGGVL